MATKKLRVGLIGANATYGWAPRAHIPALLALPEVQLAAVCTAHPETARQSASKFGVPLAFHDHREMLRRADIDAVAVLVRVPKHFDLTMDALRAKKHVLTEWPLGANLGEAEEMADLARRQGVRTMVGLQSRCSPAFLAFKELVDQGYIGEVLSCHMTQFSSGAATRTSDRTWQRDRRLGANTLTIAFGHAIDALRMCLGEFREVSAEVTTQVKQWHESDTGHTVDVTSPDNVLVIGVLQNGAVVSAHVAALPWHGTGFRLETYGSEGTIVLTSGEGAQMVGPRLFTAKGSDKALREVPVPAHHRWVPETVPQGPPYNVAQMWRRFAEAIGTNKRAEPDFDTAVSLHRLLEAIEKASASGQRQRL